jgi:hypothetical protein
VLSKKKSLVGKTAGSVEDWREVKAELARRKNELMETLVTVPDVLPESLVDRDAQFSEELLEAVERARHGEAEVQENLASVINLLLEGSLPGKSCQILAAFLDLHKKTLEQECLTVVRTKGRRYHLITRNLFVPISRGGMGVIPPIGWKYKITSNQRMLCYLLESMNRIPFVPSCCPLPGYPIGDVRTTKVMPFDVHVDQTNVFDVSSRPFGFGPKFLRRFRAGHIEMNLGIRYYSPNDSVLVRRIRQPFLAGKAMDPNLRPALTEAQKALQRPTMAEVYHSKPTHWDLFEEPTIWEPDQPYDRFRVGGWVQPYGSFTVGWVRDLTDDGDVESNPGPLDFDLLPSLSETESEEDSVHEPEEDLPFNPEFDFPGTVVGQIIDGHIVWFG